MVMQKGVINEMVIHTYHGNSPVDEFFTSLYFFLELLFYKTPSLRQFFLN